MMSHMLYHFELQMAGVILLGAMLVCGVFLYTKRRRDRLQEESKASGYGGGGGGGDDDDDDNSNAWPSKPGNEDTKKSDAHKTR